MPSPHMLPKRRDRPRLPPLQPLPRLSSPARQGSALYFLDAGIGFAAAHAFYVDRLAEHYGSNLRVCETVVNEWRLRSVRQPYDGEDPIEARLRSAGQYLIKREPDLWSAMTVHLEDRDEEGVAALQEQLRQLPPAEVGKDTNPAHAGECATVLVAGRQVTDSQVVILCANDRKAGELAKRYGMHTRSAPHILHEMCIAGTLSPEEAFDLHLKGLEISKPCAGVLDAFADPSAFAPNP